MLLQKLVEYTGRISGLPPSLYEERPIRYVIELGEDGKPLSRSPVDTADLKSRGAKRGTRRYAPAIQRTTQIKPLLMSDGADYTFGLFPNEATEQKKKRIADCHTKYMDILRRCENETKEATLGSVLAFLENRPLDCIDLPEDFDEAASFTFRVSGSLAIDLPSVQRFWAKEHGLDATNRTASQCLSCGRVGSVLDRMPLKIKGIPGGQPSGTALISANEKAFESYGLKNAGVSPLCAACGERVSKGLNHLLRTEANRYITAESAFVFWTREECEFSLHTFLQNPDSEEVLALLRSVQSGKLTVGVDETAFYGVSFTGSGGRAVVRDWIDTSVGEVKHSLARWFQDQEIANWDNSASAPLGLFKLAHAAARFKQNPSPSLIRALMRTALLGSPLPKTLLYQAIKRNLAERKVTHSRASLIKLVLLSQHADHQEEDMVQLNKTHPSAAYHCGRLLAELEAVQKLAIPGIRTTVVDRFYGTASTAPASVFSTLIRGAQPHLAKLKRDKGGSAVALQRQIEDICSVIQNNFPRVLTLEEQGLFSLGYYHQRAYDRAAAVKKAAEKRQVSEGSSIHEA